MKTKLFAILILAGCFLLMNQKTAKAQYNFDDVVNQAVLGWGETGEWDAGLVWMPCVIKDGDIFKMWYTGADDWLFSGPPSKIGHAWSTDGIVWNRSEANPVLESEFLWEGTYLIGCAVIKDDDLFKMWYGATSNPMSASTIIGYATSSDGIIWTKHPTPVLELGPENEWDDGIIQPSTVIKEGDIYKMWYWAGRPGFPFEQSMPQSGMATSTDGINWTKYNDPATTEAPFVFSDPVLTHGPEGVWDESRAINPMVIKNESGYEMCYVGLDWTDPLPGIADQIGYAQSEDGINWVKYPEPVFTDPREWGIDINGGTLLFFDQKYHLWSCPFHFPDLGIFASPQIGYATATTPQQMVGDIIAKVEALKDAGVLNKGQANALIKKLKSAKKSIDQENYNAAINKLNAFINQVNAYINGGILTEEQGYELIADAQAIIDILENLLEDKSSFASPVINGEFTDSYELKQNYPNPFKDLTTISFIVPEANLTTLKIYNTIGQEVATLFDQKTQADYTYQIEFNGTGLAEGIYICVLRTENATHITKMIKMKE